MKNKNNNFKELIFKNVLNKRKKFDEITQAKIDFYLMIILLLSFSCLSAYYLYNFLKYYIFQDLFFSIILMIAFYFQFESAKIFYYKYQNLKKIYSLGYKKI